MSPATAQVERDASVREGRALAVPPTGFRSTRYDRKSHYISAIQPPCEPEPSRSQLTLNRLRTWRGTEPKPSFRNRLILLLLTEPVLRHGPIRFVDYDAGNPVFRSHFQKNLAHPPSQSLRYASQHHISGSLRRQIGSQRQPLQLLFQLALTQQECKRRANVIQLPSIGPARLPVTRNVKPRIFPIAHKQLLSGRTVLPPHLARFFHPSLGQPKRPRFNPLHPRPAIYLGKLRLQGVKTVVMLIDGRSDGMDVL